MPPKLQPIPIAASISMIAASPAIDALTPLQFVLYVKLLGHESDRAAAARLRATPDTITPTNAELGLNSRTIAIALKVLEGHRLIKVTFSPARAIEVM